jgi:hypothetical protein
MILTLPNTEQAATELAMAIIQDANVIPVWDLDGVLLSANHRIKLHSDGSLDLDHYRANTTAELVQQDQSLPLLAVVGALNAANRPYYVATARVLCEHTRALLADRGITPALALGRDGDSDHRRDADLKRQKLSEVFTPQQLQRVLLIDDHYPNCLAVVELGGKAINVERCTLA